MGKISSACKAAAKKKFKAHPMYKDCKVKMAFKKEDHDKLEKKGYSHKKDKSCKK
jgi:hypothetical protein